MNDLPPLPPVSPQSTAEVAGARRVQDPLARAGAISGEVKDAAATSPDRDADGHQAPGHDGGKAAPDEKPGADEDPTGRDRRPSLGIVIDVEA
ncbi:hypothetical protein EDM80_04170 [bacterium]|nr:MAG: hypothetical protein EDM80_04170 [bacterium]RIK63558.1 MAG: hypothetical protein DCC64_06860 [Planctomycetota bacterium]